MVEVSVGGWRNKHRADLVSQRFIDVRQSSLNDQRDIQVDTRSIQSIKKQIAENSITWEVRYHGVVLPQDFSFAEIESGSHCRTTNNCEDPSYKNFFIFTTTSSVDWFILSPLYNY